LLNGRNAVVAFAAVFRDKPKALMGDERIKAA